jgi:hypothetical protein
MDHGLVETWELDPDVDTAALCAGSGPTITPARWSRDIPDLP